MCSHKHIHLQIIAIGIAATLSDNIFDIKQIIKKLIENEAINSDICSKYFEILFYFFIDSQTATDYEKGDGIIPYIITEVYVENEKKK